ncbi:DoxX family protein [Halpernia frigidisoli]|uniref:Putative oxidoreductase n=1 Tax=Halpernia frigidisoli TaxID=1125876 RepID=A0A1I3DTS1_9FLAO|nr:DoxX family protein [Halpernia frigidisoli]SFH89901.1 putative oxidoreductase [Halpernia frigidisoli]
MNLNSVSFNKNALAIVLVLVRIFVGFAMLTHGYPKLQKLLSGEEIQFYNFLGLGSKFTLILTVFAEVICSLFLILGLFTRTFAIPLVITMAVAAFITHASDAFAEKEMAMLYLSIYIVILVCGGGRYSIDALVSNKKNF